MTKISVAIATWNEEKNIATCLKSVSWADEVVVVDGQSSDKTAVIAKKMGATVYIVPNQLLMKKNMNLAFSKCQHEWVFSIDADEEVSPALANEIREIVKDSSFTAFRLPRRNIIFGHPMEHSGWYPDYLIRIFKKGHARFPEKNVHEDLEVTGDIGTLKEPLIHHHYNSISEWIKRLDSYTSREAEKLIADKKVVHWPDAIRFPLSEFLSRFFDRQGYRDGLHGLVLSLLYAFYWELVFAKVWEHQKFEAYISDSFLEEVVVETKQVSRGWHHWLNIATQDPGLKVARKIKNKLRQTFL